MVKGGGLFLDASISLGKEKREYAKPTVRKRGHPISHNIDKSPARARSIAFPGKNFYHHRVES